MNWLSRFLPGSGPGLTPEQQASLDLAGKLPAPDLARSHYETRYVVVNTETGPADGASQRLLAVGAVAINRGLIHPDDAFQARLGDAPADALTSVPAVESLNDLLAAVHEARAGALVSYDDGGGYGHPDYVHAHRIARAVAHALDLPFWRDGGLTMPISTARMIEDATGMVPLSRIDGAGLLDEAVGVAVATGATRVASALGDPVKVAAAIGAESRRVDAARPQVRPRRTQLLELAERRR